MARKQNRNRRRGAVIVLVIVTLIALIGMASLSVDVDLQIAADAAAMAAAWELFDEQRLSGAPNTSDDIAAARTKASEYAGRHYVLGSTVNVTTSDVTVGFISDVASAVEPLSFGDPSNFNAVHVIARRDSERDGPIGLQFANIFGRGSKDVSASAIAAFQTGVTGFSVPPDGTVGLAPFTISVDAWNGMLDGSWSSGDSWGYDSTSEGVVGSGDGIFEINMYPGSGGSALPPGNFGTVDIGASGNSTADLVRQITEGANADDLSYFGGTVELNDEGYLDLNGDTGLSAGIESAVESIIGETRIIPLFEWVVENGDNATFRIVGWGGVRFMDVNLHGNPNKKRIIVQPALVSDPGAIPGGGTPAGDFVYGAVVLVR